MKVLVTGASGRLGPYVIKELEEHGHELVLMSRRRPLSADRWQFIEGDIRDLETCRKAAKGVDAIVHLAAHPRPTDRYGKIAKQDEDLPPGWTMEVNIMGTYNILQAALTNKVGIVVMTSSNCVLGHIYRSSNRPFPFRYLPVDENHPSDIEDSYSFSKKVCEQLLETYSRTYGLRTYAVRAAGICPPERRKQMAENAKPTEIWSDSLWAWVGSEDVARAHRLLMEQAEKIERHGCYYCNADDTSIIEPTMEYIAKFRPDLLPFVEKLEGYASMFSNRKLKETTGWVHKTSWRTI